MVLVALSTSSACKTSSGPQASSAPGVSLASITVTSKSLPSDSQIPVDYTCDGKDVPPQLTWSAPPQGTKAIVVVLSETAVRQEPFTETESPTAVKGAVSGASTSSSVSSSSTSAISRLANSSAS